MYEESMPQVQKYFVEEKFTEGSINLYIATLERKLNNLGIYISSIEYSKMTDKYQIDEQQLYENIIDLYKSRNSNFDEESKRDTINRDIRSLSLMYREMRGCRSTRIETSKNFFVTTNKALACACKNFDENIGKKKCIAPCITDIFLGTILWFQNPIRYDKLKESQIIANCYAAVRPSSVIINKFSKEVEKLKDDNQITKEDYILLKNREVLDSMLSDKVVGNIENVNEDTTYEILNDIKSELKRELTEKLDEEKRKNKEIEEERNNIIKKNEETIKAIKKEADKKARIKVSIYIFICIIIPTIAIILDIVFNIIELFGSESKTKIIICRITIYAIMGLISIREIIREIKSLEEKKDKEYRKVCKKYNIE